MRVMSVLTLALPLVAYSLVAGAQAKGPSKGGAPSGSASAIGTTAAPSTAASADSSSSSSPSPGAAAGTPPAAVSVDMTTKAPPNQGMNGATYAVRLRDLEQQVDELKDQIRRSHTRLALLSDTIVGGGAAGSRAEVDFKNEMSSAFLLTRALFVIDGQVQYNRQDDSGALADQKDIPLYSGSVPPGDHTIQVSLTFQGNGYGIFSYLRGYKFEVKSSHAFTAIEGKSLAVTATAFEKGGVTTPLEQRPTIEWHEKIEPLGAGVGPSGPGTPTSGAAPGASVSGRLSIGGASGGKK
jgi:hypothetical protein